MKIETWTGCYKPNGWKGIIVDEAFAHPAKFSRYLIERIYVELALAPGSLVLDPFGGVALGAWVAMKYGLEWHGVELEERFVTLGRANLAKWRNHSRQVMTLHHGDSRLIGGDVFDAVVSSPPFSEGSHCQPPTNRLAGAPVRSVRQAVGVVEGCGTSPGNLAAMKPGDFDAVLSSPPYADSIRGEHGERETAEVSRSARVSAGGALGVSQRSGGYGGLGNLGNATGETFWQAARQIVANCFAMLRPGGVAVWVTKDYVKKGRREPFTANWRRLCESLGFTTTRHVHASFIETSGKERKSFFRRLAETNTRRRNYWATLPLERKARFIAGSDDGKGKLLDAARKVAWQSYLDAKGDPRGYGDETIIDHEDVLFMVKG